MKKIALLGATGSIGQSTLEVVRNHPERFEIVIASSHSKYELLKEITKEIPIEHIVMTSNENNINDASVLQGDEALLDLVRNSDYDILLNAVVGSAGLKYTIASLESGHDIALANKESMVMAGELVTELAQKHSCKIIPVDSEHSAIMQCMEGVRDKSQVRKIILTASGGPFHNVKKEAFKNISLRDALQHPTWAMGDKITIDSATMANKGLEVIEAHYLFNMPYDDIDVIIHPQSVIHSMVEFIDGSIIAQLSFPDMKIPIQYALSYPDRITATAAFTDISQIHELTFYRPHYEKFPLLGLAFEVGKVKGIMPTIFNAANEAAVTLFLQEKISFVEIPVIIQNELNRDNISNPDIDTIVSIDAEIKKKIFDTYN